VGISSAFQMADPLRTHDHCWQSQGPPFLCPLPWKASSPRRSALCSSYLCVFSFGLGLGYLWHWGVTPTCTHVLGKCSTRGPNLQPHRLVSLTSHQSQIPSVSFEGFGCYAVISPTFSREEMSSQIFGSQRTRSLHIFKFILEQYVSSLSFPV
jgi:hypothetical protein